MILAAAGLSRADAPGDPSAVASQAQQAQPAWVSPAVLPIQSPTPTPPPVYQPGFYVSLEGGEVVISNNDLKDFVGQLYGGGQGNNSDMVPAYGLKLGYLFGDGLHLHTGLFMGPNRSFSPPASDQPNPAGGPDFVDSYGITTSQMNLLVGGGFRIATSRTFGLDLSLSAGEAVFHGDYTESHSGYTPSQNGSGGFSVDQSAIFFMPELAFQLLFGRFAFDAGVGAQIAYFGYLTVSNPTGIYPSHFSSSSNGYAYSAHQGPPLYFSNGKNAWVSDSGPYLRAGLSWVFWPMGEKKN
jgi:hypothetical protein